MKIKHIITIIVMFLVVTPSAKADVICDKKDMLRVKNDSNKVIIDYELNSEAPLNGLFNLKITGITEDLSILDTKANKRYTINSVVDDIITIENVSGNDFVFKIYYDRCDSKLLRTIKYNLPKYNYYSEEKECENIDKDELEVCNPWYQGELTKEIFEQKIKEYQKQLEIKQEEEKKENTIFKQIIDFLLNYYVYIIAIILLIIIIITVIVVRKKRYSLE